MLLSFGCRGFCPWESPAGSAEDEAEGCVKLDGEKVDDDDRGAVDNAGTEGVEDVGKAAQASRHKAEGDGDQAHPEGDDRHKAAAEGRGEEMARGREEDGVGRQREQGQDDEIDGQEDERDTEGKAVAER